MKAQQNLGSTGLRAAVRLVAASMLLAASISAWAQAYPSKPIRVIIPIAAGSSGDLLLRQVLPKMSEFLGQGVFVDNRTGGGGLVGTTAAIKSAADGYTLLFAYSQIVAVNPSLYKSLPYDPIKDLAPIGRVAAQPLVFVASKALPIKTVAEFVAYGKANPGKLSYASSGVGTSAHLGGAYISQLAEVGAVHAPYNSVPQALVDLARGDVSYMLYPYPGLLPVLQNERVQALAVTGPRRSSFLPQLPTMVELGYSGFVVGPWYALYAPAGTPKEIVDKLNQALNHAIDDKDIRKQFADSGTDPWPSTPEELGRFTLTEIDRYRRLVQISGAKVE